MVFDRAAKQSTLGGFKISKGLPFRGGVFAADSQAWTWDGLIYFIMPNNLKSNLNISCKGRKILDQKKIRLNIVRN